MHVTGLLAVGAIATYECVSCTRLCAEAATKSAASSFLFINALRGRYENSHEQLPETKLERLFLYCLCWSLGGLLSDKERPSFDAELRSIGGSLPPK
jgi:hypothetical protein